MKGQYFSFDAIIASVIFVLALVALLSYWHSVRSFLDYQSGELSKDAIRISNLLFTPSAFTPSAPSADCESIERLGFAIAWDDKRADSSVIACPQGQDQVWLRGRLGSSYNVSIKITNLADDTVVATLGGPVPDSANDVVKIRRLTTVVDSTAGTDYLAAVDLSVYN